MPLFLLRALQWLPTSLWMDDELEGLTWSVLLWVFLILALMIHPLVHSPPPHCLPWYSRACQACFCGKTFTHPLPASRMALPLNIHMALWFVVSPPQTFIHVTSMCLLLTILSKNCNILCLLHVLYFFLFYLVFIFHSFYHTILYNIYIYICMYIIYQHYTLKKTVSPCKTLSDCKIHGIRG